MRLHIKDAEQFHRQLLHLNTSQRLRQHLNTSLIGVSISVIGGILAKYTITQSPGSDVS